MRHHKDFLRLSLRFTPVRRFRLSFPRHEEGGNERTLNELGFASWCSVIAANDLEGDFARASWLYGKLPQYSESLLAFASQEQSIAKNTFRVSMVVDEGTLRILRPQNWKFRFVSQECVDPTAVPPHGYVLQAELAKESDICHGALLVIHEEFLKLLDIYICHNMKHILYVQMRRTHPQANAMNVDSQFTHILSLAGLKSINGITDRHGMNDKSTIDPLWIWPLTQGQAIGTARALVYQAQTACFPELSEHTIRVYFDHSYMRWARNRKVHYMQHLIADPSDYSFPVPSFKRNLTAENLRSVHIIEAAEATGQLKNMGSLQVREAVMKILRREGIIN